MESLIQVFRMNELSNRTRVNVLKKLGEVINNQYGGNYTEEIVIELILALDSSFEQELRDDVHYGRFMQPKDED